MKTIKIPPYCRRLIEGHILEVCYFFEPNSTHIQSSGYCHLYLKHCHVMPEGLLKPGFCEAKKVIVKEKEV
jgi:hypothetical protein